MFSLSFLEEHEILAASDMRSSMSVFHRVLEMLISRWALRLTLTERDPMI